MHGTHKIESGLVIALVIAGFCFSGFVNTWYEATKRSNHLPHASIEIQHIINCQDEGTGAINDVWGEPTWVVPGEMALATIALHVMGHTDRAIKACEYLAAVQDPVDGAWANQYSGYSAVDQGKYARQTAQVLMAFHICGFTNVTAITKGIDFLLGCLDASPSGDGLVRGGKAADGSTIGAKWLSDNVFAGKVFEYFNHPVEHNNVVSAIDVWFLMPGGNHWYQYKDDAGFMYEGDFGWINFAPPVFGLDCAWPTDMAGTIRGHLQTSGGAVLEHSTSTKKMPGIGLQAQMALREAGGGEAFITAFSDWLARSDLVQNQIDPNGDVGGIIDWRDDTLGTTANWWERFIDTSAFVIFNEMDFYF